MICPSEKSIDIGSLILRLSICVAFSPALDFLMIESKLSIVPIHGVAGCSLGKTDPKKPRFCSASTPNGAGWPMCHHCQLNMSCCAGSVDGLVEASKMSRVCGGVGNETMCAIYRIGMEVVSALAKASATVRRPAEVFWTLAEDTAIN